MGTGKTYSLDDTIFFGNHKGKTIQFIIDNDRGYMSYLLNNQEFQLNEKAFDYYFK